MQHEEAANRQDARGEQPNFPQLSLTSREEAEGNTTRMGTATMPASTKYLLRQKSGVLGARQGSGTGGRSILRRDGGLQGGRGLFGGGVRGLGRVLGRTAGLGGLGSLGSHFVLFWRWKETRLKALD